MNTTILTVLLPFDGQKIGQKFMIVSVNSNFTTFYLQSYVGRFISRILFKSAFYFVEKFHRFLKYVLIPLYCLC